MFDDILKRMQGYINRRDYVMTLHAEEEMNNDGLSIYDVEHCMLAGSITARQADKISNDWKYCVTGTAVDGNAMEVVAKFGPTGMLIIITVYVL